MDKPFSPDGWWRWDGTEWVSNRSPDGFWLWNGEEWRPLRRPPVRPIRYVLPTVAAVVVGLAIWIPTMALQPRYSYTGESDQPWFVVLMFIAPIILGIVFAERWQTIAPGLVVPQLLLAPYTTPRGDGDGLWVLIFPMLVFMGGAIYLLVYFVAWLTRHRSRPADPVRS